MRRKTFAVGILIGILSIGVGIADTLTLTRPATSGHSSRIAYERAWNKDCSQAEAVVTITRQPAHGTVAVVASTSAIPTSTPRMGSTGACAGTTVGGNAIMYTSAPGFHGQDFVSWDVVYRFQSQKLVSGSTDVTVNVR